MVQLSEAERARYVNRMFGRIARRYDCGNRILSLGRDQSWRRKTIKLLDPKPQDIVLDVGAGTADLSIELARQARRVVAADFTLPMLTVGVYKAKRTSRSDQIDFVTADALCLPMADATFDGAASAFTVRNFSNMESGLREIRRVLKPGGRFACLEFTQPPSRAVKGVYHPYLKHILPRMGGRITGDTSAYRYLAESIDAFPSAESLADLMRQAGFERVTWQLLSFGVCAVHLAEKGV